MCTCLKQKLLNIQYNKSNISPKENIEKIKEIALNFVENFDDPQEKNLLFTGNTGLGKTYLTNCIANELLKQGKERGKTCRFGAIKYNWNFYNQVKHGELDHPTFDINEVDFLTILDDPGYWIMRCI